MEPLTRIASPPTDETAGNIELIFGLAIHMANINSAIMAILEFPPRTPKTELQIAKTSTFADISKWSITLV